MFVVDSDIPKAFSKVGIYRTILVDLLYNEVGRLAVITVSELK